jgi:hypothetical protein
MTLVNKDNNNSLNPGEISVINKEQTIIVKKGLKIPKGQSKSVYRRRTNNTMAKRKKYKRTNNDLQNIHIKLKIE